MIYVFNKKILFESAYIGLTLANAVVGGNNIVYFVRYKI